MLDTTVFYGAYYKHNERRNHQTMKSYQNLSNEEYWIKRSEEKLHKRWKAEERTEKEINKIYRAYHASLKTILSDFYNQYAVDNKLEYADTIKYLDNMSLQDYKINMNRLIVRYSDSGNEQLLSELRNLANPPSLTVIQALINNLISLFLEMGYEELYLYNQSLTEQYSESYYESIFEIYSAFGIGRAFEILSNELIKESLNYPWSGATFSDRIWDNKRLLIKSLKEEITSGLIRGDSYQNMARALNQKMNTGYKNSLRLIRTETSYVIAEGTWKGYKKSGSLHQYIIIATLDNRTSTICQSMDNQHFNLEDKELGVNFPPFHANCRTCIAPYFGDVDLASTLRRARDPLTNKTYMIPGNMSYQQWKEKYVN